MSMKCDTETTMVCQLIEFIKKLLKIMGTFDYFGGEKSLFMHWDKDLIMSLINLEYLVIMFYSI